MSNVIEFVKGDRKVLVSKDLLPLTGAVLGTMAEKPLGVNRFGVLKNKRVSLALQASKIVSESQQVQEIGKVFKTLQAKGIIELHGERVQTAMIVDDYTGLAQEVVQAAEKIDLSVPVVAKRGRPAGSSAKSQGSNGVKRNPVMSQRYWLNDGKVMPFGRGRPSFAMLSQECDTTGKIVADLSKLPQPKAAKEGKSMKVRRNPAVKAEGRFYLLNGEVTPFGRGRPGLDKIANECDKAGNIIADPNAVAAMRQPRQSTGTGKANKVAQLESQLAEMREMMAKMMAAMSVGVVAPSIAVAVEVPQTVQETAEVVVKQEKVSKPKASKPKVAKAKKVRQDDEMIDEDDAYANFANISGDLGDDDPIAFDSNGFVVTEIEM